MSSGIFIDSCIIINHWRTPNRDSSILSQIRQKHKYIYISVITEYEILNGMTESFQKYWDECLTWLIVLPVDQIVVRYASRIKYQLKIKQKTIDIADILIAATALTIDVPIATINRRHFEQIDGLEIVSLK
ncbi:MAG: type II toxin-antitoxin system VapC family toxin [Planctomycetaceae bacterium]|jgi:predicted nucleic acid-binding protein|nr:type II toxin-antitoxin system VapC family toxin [Planctomycetaceae bacterium]